MKLILGVGALLTLVFWGVVVGNLVQPYAQPFSMLLNLAGAVVLAAHIVELWYFKSALQQSSTPRLSRVKVLVLGVFHAYSLARDVSVTVVPEISVADTIEQTQPQAANNGEPEGDSHLQLHMQFEPMAESQHA